MNDKIEIAKLATQLTVVMLSTKDGDINSITHDARVVGRDKNTPTAFTVFDAAYKHIQATLSAQ